VDAINLTGGHTTVNNDDTDFKIEVSAGLLFTLMPRGYMTGWN
jgi:hypothetical protein